MQLKVLYFCLGIGFYAIQAEGKKPLCSELKGMYKIMSVPGTDCIEDKKPTPSDSSCQTTECMYAKIVKGMAKEPPSQPATNDSKPLEQDQTLGQPKIEAKVPDPTPEEKPSNQKPACQDFIEKGVNAASEGQIDIDCIGFKASTPDVASPSQPSVKSPPQTELPAGGKINVG